MASGTRAKQIQTIIHHHQIVGQTSVENKPYVYRLFLVAYFLLSFSLGSCQSQQKEGEIFLFPNGYVGSAIIVFNQKQGKDILYDENKNRIYEFDSSGYLFTKFAPNNGFISTNKINYFYYDPKSKKRISKLDYLWLNRSKLDSVIFQKQNFVTGLITGTISALDHKSKINYLSLSIYSPFTFKETNDFIYKSKINKIDSLPIILNSSGNK